ncbi:hypothetical protein Patl1_26819 [Pistacia atlantica]|uniref:Uncharacterized protein n=1 Tax=Pistacia atlantica TaxID=434234 RepID=A0ACC1B210_9ROSI|nr:hypothetical protein Patl1_26819 [Pistacia atlantica]
MVETIGSCNGLFCLYVPKRRVFYFYNPSTRECSMEVPNYMNEYLQLILLKERKDDYPIEGEGFGYAPSIDDYKMVILSAWTTVTRLLFKKQFISMKRISLEVGLLSMALYTGCLIPVIMDIQLFHSIWWKRSL